MTEWLEIAVPFSGDEACADDVGALLAETVPDAGAGVEIRAGEIVFWVPIEGRDAVLRATRSAVSELAAAGLPLDPARVEARAAVPEAEWRDAWKRYFRSVRLTRQIVVVPSWDRHDPGPDDRVVHLDPGQAFGTGAHESTRLVLRVLQDLADRGAGPGRILDLGTGSGILALAASLLWPRAEILAIDSDPLAVAAARENADANGLGARVQVECGELESAAGGVGTSRPGAPGGDAGTFDLALANIQADVLSALAAPLCARIAPGGWLVLSGLLAEQARPVADLYCEHGMALDQLRAGDEDPSWSALVLRCSASS